LVFRNPIDIKNKRETAVNNSFVAGNRLATKKLIKKRRNMTKERVI
jgi:hypothetical protein